MLIRQFNSLPFLTKYKWIGFRLVLQLTFMQHVFERMPKPVL
jgi:hypothetical protein